MLRLLGRIPSSHFHVACSGGSDSMVLVDLLRRFPRNRFDLLHFNHGTECCAEAEAFVREYCRKTGLEGRFGRISRDRRKGEESQEEYWRNCRYAFFREFSDEPILMAHHLNDCVETWVMTCMSGEPRLIPYRNEKYNVVRPLLATSKADIEAWAKEHSVEYVYDRSNSDTSINRNFVRHVMLKDVRRLNPGIEKTVRRMVLKRFEEENSPKD